MGLRLQSLCGLFALVGVAWLCCPRDRRRAISWRCVGWGLGLQFLAAVLILKLPTVRWVFEAAKNVANALLAHAGEGGRMVFGVLMDNQVLGQTFGPQNSSIFAIQTIIPVIVFIASLTAVLYHLGVMQRIVGAIARVMVRFMGTSGAETLAAVSNVFVGMTEAPLLIRPYLDQMTRSELLTMMIGGMCTIAGTVFAVYVGFLQDALPNIAGHLLTASVLSAPAGLAIAKLMLPETDEPATLGKVALESGRTHANVMDALTGGATEGLKLAANVIAMLIAMVAIVSLCNGLLGWPARVHNQHVLATIARQAGESLEVLPADWPTADDPAGLAELAAEQGVSARPWQPLTFERIASWVFRPLAWCLGVPPQDVAYCSRLLGEKTVLNEFVAYLHLGLALQADPQTLTERGRVLISYALCGFANFGSVAIMIGGIGGLAPSRRRDLAELGLVSLVGGTLAACMTGCVVGLLTAVG